MAPVITDEEFKRNSRDCEDPFLAAVQYAVGAASVCWESPENAGAFDADRAATIAEDLVRYLRKNWCLMQRSDVAWLGVLLENAKPRHPGDPRRDWEGQGRANAARIISQAIEPTDTRRKRGVPAAPGVQRGLDRIARR
jgi:hypothetical protein